MLMAAWSICHHFYGLSCQHCVLVPKTYHLVLNTILILLSKYLRLIEFSGFIHLFSFLIHLVKPTLKQLSILTLQFGVPFLCCLNLELKGLQFIVDDLISVSIGFIGSMKKRRTWIVTSFSRNCSIWSSHLALSCFAVDVNRLILQDPISVMIQSAQCIVYITR